MLRLWDCKLEISKCADASIHAQLTSKIINEIKCGAFMPGTVLPGTRQLSQQLGVNRKTVSRVYEELIAHGWLYTEYKRGTFVAAKTDTKQPQPSKNNSLASKASVVTTDIVAPKNNPYKIDFTYPYGDSRIFNFEAISRATRHAVMASKRIQPISDNKYGLDELRYAIVQMLNLEKNMHVQLPQLFIAPSAQLALYLVADVLSQTQDAVIFEQYSQPQVSDLFAKKCGLHRVKHSAQGIDLLDLEKLCINYPITALYLTPQCQQPTTHQMPLENKMALLKLAKKYQFWIIEDTTQSDYSYDLKPNATLASLSQDDNIIYIGGLSHILSASYKSVYVTMPEALRKVFNKAQSLMGDCHNLINELTLTELLLSGEAKKQLRRTTKIYTERKNHFCHLLQQQLSEYLSFTSPNAGFSVWASIKPKVNIDQLKQQLQQAKINITFGDSYTQNKNDQSYITLYFAHLNLEEQNQAIQSLNQIFKQATQTIATQNNIKMVV